MRTAQFPVPPYVCDALCLRAVARGPRPCSPLFLAPPLVTPYPDSSGLSVSQYYADSPWLEKKYDKEICRQNSLVLQVPLTGSSIAATARIPA